MVEFCTQHAVEGMIDIKSKRCRHEGCKAQLSFSISDRDNPDFCSQHTSGGILVVKCETVYENFRRTRHTLDGISSSITSEGKHDSTSKRCRMYSPNKTSPTIPGDNLRVKNMSEN